MHMCVYVAYVSEGRRREEEERPRARVKERDSVVTGSGRDLISFTFPLPESEVNSFILQKKLNFFSNPPK